jgi:hypothetical protein
MRICYLGPLGVLALVAASAPASAQVYVTSVTAAIPDPNNKVPGFNKVPGAGIENWANGVAQVVLVHGQSYNYCVSLGSAKANGTAGVTYTIARKKTIIQSGVIIAPGGLTITADQIMYVCSGYTVLPTSPGTATLTGTVSYTPNGKTKAAVSKVTTGVVLQ